MVSVTSGKSTRNQKGSPHSQVFMNHGVAARATGSQRVPLALVIMNLIVPH